MTGACIILEFFLLFKVSARLYYCFLYDLITLSIVEYTLVLMKGGKHIVLYGACPSQIGCVGVSSSTTIILMKIEPILRKGKGYNLNGNV